VPAGLATAHALAREARMKVNRTLSCESCVATSDQPPATRIPLRSSIGCTCAGKSPECPDSQLGCGRRTRSAVAPPEEALARRCLWRRGRGWHSGLALEGV
jgi:hypothetical protein